MDRRLTAVVLTLVMMMVLAWTVVGGAADGGSDKVYVASTAWTGAIARAAGARNVQVLAPLDLRHPPEYDFRPSDVQKALEADMIFWGGYEGFIRNLVAANDIPEEKLCIVATNNSPDHLVEHTRALAEKLGTQDLQRAWEAEFVPLSQRVRERAAAQGTENIKVLVSFHQEKLVRWLGYDVVGIIGVNELTPNQIAELIAAEPDMVIENWHSAQAQPVADAAGAKYVELLNFPGTHGTDTIDSVFIYNMRQLGLLD